MRSRATAALNAGRSGRARPSRNSNSGRTPRRSPMRAGGLGHPPRPGQPLEIGDRGGEAHPSGDPLGGRHDGGPAGDPVDAASAAARTTRAWAPAAVPVSRTVTTLSSRAGPRRVGPAAIALTGRPSGSRSPGVGSLRRRVAGAPENGAVVGHELGRQHRRLERGRHACETVSTTTGRPSGLDDRGGVLAGRRRARGDRLGEPAHQLVERESPSRWRSSPTINHSGTTRMPRRATRSSEGSCGR